MYQELADEVCRRLEDLYPDTFEVSDLYTEKDFISVEITSGAGYTASSDRVISKGGILSKSLFRYVDVIVRDLQQEFEEVYRNI